MHAACAPLPGDARDAAEMMETHRHHQRVVVDGDDGGPASCHIGDLMRAKVIRNPFFSFPELLLPRRTCAWPFRCRWRVHRRRACIFSDAGETKRFHTLDGHGIVAATGGHCSRRGDRARLAPLRLRLHALGVEHAIYGTEDKRRPPSRSWPHWADWMQAAAMGDDWPDLPMMRRSALPARRPMPMQVPMAHHDPGWWWRGGARVLQDLLVRPAAAMPLCWTITTRHDRISAPCPGQARLYLPVVLMVAGIGTDGGCAQRPDRAKTRSISHAATGRTNPITDDEPGVSGQEFAPPWAAADRGWGRGTPLSRYRYAGNDRVRLRFGLPQGERVVPSTCRPAGAGRRQPEVQRHGKCLDPRDAACWSSASCPAAPGVPWRFPARLAKLERACLQTACHAARGKQDPSPPTAWNTTTWRCPAAASGATYDAHTPNELLRPDRRHGPTAPGFHHRRSSGIGQALAAWYHRAGWRWRWWRARNRDQIMG